jgi:hypothetical protein
MVEESKDSEKILLPVVAEGKNIGDMLDVLSKEMLKYSETDKQNIEELLQNISQPKPSVDEAPPEKKTFFQKMGNRFKNLDNSYQQSKIISEVKLKLPKQNVDPNMGVYPTLQLTEESYDNLKSPGNNEKLKSIYIYYFCYLLNKFIILPMMTKIDKGIIDNNIKELRKFIEHSTFGDISLELKPIFLQVCSQLEKAELNPFDKSLFDTITSQIQQLHI